MATVSLVWDGDDTWEDLWQDPLPGCRFSIRFEQILLHKRFHERFPLPGDFPGGVGVHQFGQAKQFVVEVADSGWLVAMLVVCQIKGLSFGGAVFDGANDANRSECIQAICILNDLGLDRQCFAIGLFAK